MYAYSSNWIVLFPIAFSMFVALRLNLAQHEDQRRTTSVLLVRLTIATLFLFAFLAIGLRPSFLSGVWLVMLGVLSVVFWWKNRRLDRSAMLLTLLNAKNDEQRLQVSSAFYHGNLGFVRRRALAFYRYLTGGASWEQALESSGIAKTNYERLASRLQARFGPGASDGISGLKHPLHVEQEIERSLGRLMIFSWVLFLLPIIALFMTFVVPTFLQMFEEFALELPPLMRVVIAVSDDFSSFGWTSLFWLLPIGLFVVITAAVLLWLFPSLTRLPGLRWLFGDYYSNLGLSALAQVSQKEADLVRACQTTADVLPVDFLADRYRSAASLMLNGMPPGKALHTADLMNSREVAAISLGLESQSHAWAFSQIASWKTDRMLRKISVIVQCLLVLLTLFLGLIVGAFVVGVIQCLSVMIMEMTYY